MDRSKLKNRRLELGYTLQEVADKMGLTRSTIQKYESGLIKGVDTKTLEMLAGVLETTPAYLMGWASGEGDDIYQYDNVFPYEPRKIPMLGEVACGTPIYTNEEYDSFIESDIKADFCLRAKGDSMINARIHDGDVVFVKRQSIVDNGEIAVVIIDEEATLKRIYRTKESLTLVAENPLSPPMVYTEQDGKAVRILGKAIAFQSDIK